MSTPYNRTIKDIVIHHMGDGLSPDVSILQRWNPNEYEYPEYDYGIEADGTIRIGRPFNIQGAHCLSDKPPYCNRGDQWWNKNSMGIGLAGDFTKYSMPEAQFKALVSFVKLKMDEYDLTLDNVYPHGQVTYTDCPGCVYDKVPELKGGWNYNQFEQEILKPKKEVIDVLDVAVLLNTKEDFWAGFDVVVKNGNCALFVRGFDKLIPKDAMNAQKLIVVGGSTTNHPNEMLLSGTDKYDTASAVKKYLG